MNKRLSKLVNEDCVGVGNVWSNVQFSNYIRPDSETECNGFHFPRGKLREADLKPYREHHPFAVRLADHCKNVECVLYVWRTKYAVYGATLTDTAHRILRRCVRTGPGFTDAVLGLEAAAHLLPIRVAA